MAGFTFIHAADLHLDAPFKGVGRLMQRNGEQGFTTRPEKETAAFTRLLSEATFIALERLVDVALQENADFVLIAGDLSNSAEKSLKARLALRKAFLRLEEAGIAVFIAHGNHDPYAAEDAAVPWPANVTVFGPNAQSVHAFSRGAADSGEDGSPENTEVSGISGASGASCTSGTPGASGTFGTSGAPGAAVALIHGVSHKGQKESRNLAALLKRNEQEAHLFQIGLIHCALAGQSGEHALYAPCSFTDLAASGLDYWALGHVHTPKRFDREGKDATASGSGTFAAYPGSLQGLHVNETGPHGCLVCRVDEGQTLQAHFRPLAPVEWGQISVSAQSGGMSVPELERRIHERIEALTSAQQNPHLSPNMQGRSLPAAGDSFATLATVLRLHITGRSALHHTLRKTGAAEELREALEAALAGSSVWLRDVVIDTRPERDMETALTRPDLAGETLRLARELAQNAEKFTPFATEALDPLFGKAKMKKAVAVPDEAETRALLDEAALICFDLLCLDLSPETDPQAGFAAGPDDIPDDGPGAGPRAGVGAAPNTWGKAAAKSHSTQDEEA